MTEINNLITDNIDVWTSAIKKKSATGRGTSKKIELTGVKKLRELILELAVRGKLVPQDANDEPASVLLEKIAEEKAQLITDKKIKKQKPLTAITDEENPFELPNGWMPIRLGITFNSIASGGTPSKRESSYWGGEIPWASVKDLGTQRYISETQDYITEKGLQAGSRLANINDLLICTRMGLGKIAIVKQPMAFNQDLKSVSLTSLIDFEFFLNTYATIKIKGTGTTVAGIKQEELLNYIVGLPPLAEQHRIVAKVDELMALCDQLEQQTEQSLTAHQTLVEALLSTLTQSVNSQDFQESWQRIADHFDVLFTTEHSIEQLKQTILQLAVMGKLVPQNPSDEPASVLLEKIAEEKAQLIADKKIKRQKPLPEITEQEKQFELPDGWVWCYLQDVSTYIQRGKGPKYDENGQVKVISQKCIQWSGFILEPARFISDESLDKYQEERFLQSRDLLWNSTGTGTAGRINLLEHVENKTLVADSHVTVIRTIYIDAAFIKNYITAPGVQYRIEPGNENSLVSGTTNQVELNTSAVMSLEIPIPPLAEQQRIVAKVDELMALCDQLKTRLADAQTTQLHLADAVVENALN